MEKVIKNAPIVQQIYEPLIPLADQIDDVSIFIFSRCAENFKERFLK
jgi:hypothetical protein